jgi:hypothetical protein
MNWKWRGRKRPVPNLRCYPAFAWAVRKCTKNLSQGTLCPSQVSNWALPEYKSEALLFEPTCCVTGLWNKINVFRIFMWKFLGGSNLEFWKGGERIMLSWILRECLQLCKLSLTGSGSCLVTDFVLTGSNIRFMLLEVSSLISKFSSTCLGTFKPVINSERQSLKVLILNDCFEPRFLQLWLWRVLSLRYSDRSSQMFRSNLFSDPAYEGRKILRNFCKLLSDYRHHIGAEVAQYLWRRATGWTAGVWFQAGEILLLSTASHPASYQMGTEGIFPGAWSLTSYLHLVQRLRIAALYRHSPTRIHGIVLNRDSFTLRSVTSQK